MALSSNSAFNDAVEEGVKSPAENEKTGETCERIPVYHWN